MRAKRPLAETGAARPCLHRAAIGGVGHHRLDDAAQPVVLGIGRCKKLDRSRGDLIEQQRAQMRFRPPLG